MLNLDNTPYTLDAVAEFELLKQVKQLEERVRLLRQQNILTAETIRNYYGETRFLQVAESNAIEGSTLSVGETELAILKGMTITGHDPAYTRDAIALDQALNRLTKIAKDKSRITNIEVLQEIHSLILGHRQGAGIFRNQPIRISGSPHTPPKTWKEVMKQMEVWEKWSEDNLELAAPIRAVVLHAWLVHIHPYLDGNGRTARAISNLELVKAGYPPIIIKKRLRERYISSLSESDQGGDIRSFFELMMEHIEASLLGLERSAKQQPGYSPLREKLRLKQEQQLKIWLTSVKLLAQQIEHVVNAVVEERNGSCSVKIYENSLEIEDYVTLCQGHPVAMSWAFVVTISIPGVKEEKLAYFGYRSPMMYQALSNEGGVSLYWSVKNPEGYPKWKPDDVTGVAGIELTTKNGHGDEWYVRKNDSSIYQINTSKLVQNMVADLFNSP